jgi:hypothetical protein
MHSITYTNAGKEALSRKIDIPGRNTYPLGKSLLLLAATRGRNQTRLYSS